MANISRDTFRYFEKFKNLIFQFRRHVSDAELNEMQDIINAQIGDNMEHLFDSEGITYGCQAVENAGDKINKLKVQTGFIIKQMPATTGVSGTFGYLAIRLTENVVTGFTTPVAPRTDTLYLDVYEEEIDGVADPFIIDPIEGAETTRRMKIVTAFGIAVGAPMPAPPAGHSHFEIARITRAGGDASIDTADINTSFRTRAHLRLSYNDLNDLPTIAGATYVQPNDPSTVGGGSHNIFDGDRWFQTSPGPAVVVMHIAASDWPAGNPPDWVVIEINPHRLTHEIGGTDLVRANLLTGQGHGNGFDADTVDGSHGSAFAGAAAFTGHDHSPGDPTQVDHTNLTGVGVDQHHAQNHAARHTWGQPDQVNAANLGGQGTGGGFDADKLDGNHASAFAAAAIGTAYLAHAHAAGDPTQVNHGNLTGVTANQHHTAFTPGDHTATDHTGLTGVPPFTFDYVATPGDGIGLRNALQNAAYKSIYVPQGAYPMGATITQAAQQLVLCEPGATMVMAAGGIYFVPATGSIIHNLIIDAQNIAGDGAHGAFELGSGYLIYLYNCGVVNATAGSFCFRGNFTTTPAADVPYHEGGLYSCFAERSSVGSVGFEGISNAVNCRAYKMTYGFQQCYILTGCRAASCSISGIDNCHNVTNCRTFSNGSYGFSFCQVMSACVTGANGVNGFATCNDLSACHSEGNTGDGFASCVGMSACVSANNGGYGTRDCNYMSSIHTVTNGAGGNFNPANFCATSVGGS